VFVKQHCQLWEAATAATELVVQAPVEVVEVQGLVLLPLAQPG
jgi:hypothetical protein